MADLKDFISVVRTIGLPTASHFYVEFLGIVAGGDLRRMSLLCDQVSLPGLNLMTQEYRTFGEILESPYGVSYGPVTLSMIVDNEASVKYFFDEWANKVFDRTTRTSGYYDNYTQDVAIALIDKKKNIVYSVMLKEAYPKSISDIQLDYGNHDVIRLNVTLTYRYWEQNSDIESARAKADELIKKQQRSSETIRNNILSGAYTGNSIESNLRDWGSINDVARQYQTYGPELAGSIGRSVNGVTNAAKGTSSLNGFSSALAGLTSNFASMGSGLGDLGKSLSDVIAPAQAIAGSVSSVAGTLGSVNSTLSALGLGTPFSGVIANLNQTAGQLSTVSQLKGLPGHLGTIGANMTGMGGTFSNISKSISTASNAPKKFTEALNKLGFNLDRQGNNMQTGAANLDQYARNQ